MDKILKLAAACAEILAEHDHAENRDDSWGSVMWIATENFRGICL